MDFRGREVNFREADRRYAQLARQRDAGSISDEEFDAQRQQLMVQDGEGRWWAKLGETGDWHYLDGSAWLRDTPPGYQEPTEATNSPVQTQSPLPPKGAETGRRRIARWILAAGLIGLALVGTVLVFWVLVPYLRGGPTASKQGGSMMSEQGESAPGGAAFDALFVHHATSENTSWNSTYLDNPLTNGYPNAILYVTQNWNPGGSAGTYNNHPIGVWYDTERQRWAVFNQDREPMPEGAAFNIAVSKEPTKAR